VPPKSDPRREEALRLYLESRGKKSLQCIADELGLSKSTVASWKIRGDWEALLKANGRKTRLQTSSANTGRKKSDYYGNTNAAGKRQDVSNFMGNQNALKHGRYEQIKYDTMTKEELELMQESEAQATPYEMQIRLIMELEVRERRMLHRIETLRASAANDPDGFIADSASVEQTGAPKKDEEDGQKKGKIKIKKNRKSALAAIQDIENALSFVQRQKQSAILALHKLQQDDFAHQLEIQRLELQKQRVELDKRRLALIDPNEDSDTLKKAWEILEGIPSAF